MTIATVSPGAWDAIVTTSVDTVFQNQSQRPLYLTTESTIGLDLREGLYVAPWAAVIIAAGLDVSASTFEGDATLFYMSV